MADRDRKGRTATGSRNGYYTRPDRRRPVPVYHGIGERNGRARLSREEVKELKERLKVLERITVEKENSLAKEIESLRDR